MSNPPTVYIGRFAPSPTGELHQGSLFTALASFLDARKNRGTWLVRMEDLDPPREMPGAADSILRCLEKHHLTWDGSVLYQSQRTAAYQHALERLSRLDLTYPCSCNRQRLRAQKIYDRHCLRSPPKAGETCATRLQVPDGPAAQEDYHDLFLGRQCHQVNKETGDFIIRRKDGLFAYQLAVVADDIHQGVTHIIRGGDLAQSAPRQRLLFRLLQKPLPAMGHLPLITHADGQKLSKQNLAPALNTSDASANLFRAMGQLGLNPGPDLSGESCETLLTWAIPRWRRELVPRQKQLPGSMLD